MAEEQAHGVAKQQYEISILYLNYLHQVVNVPPFDCRTAKRFLRPAREKERFIHAFSLSFFQNITQWLKNNFRKQR